MILTLPITPREERSIGYWLAPVLADVFRRRSNSDLVLAVGLLGARTATQQSLDGFVSDSEFLGIRSTIWRDIDHDQALLGQAVRTIAVGDVRETRSEYLLCPCGLLEIPVALVRFLKEKTFYREDGRVFCGVCRAEPSPRTLPSLTLWFSEQFLNSVIEGIHIEPAFYRKELRDLLEQIKIHGIRVNRYRDTGYQFQGYHLDVEFLWQHMLAQFPARRLTLVITNHVLRQALISTLLGCFLVPEVKIEFLVVPYLQHLGRPDKWTLERLRELGHDRQTVRFLLASSLVWKEKEVKLNDAISSVEYRRFELLWRHVRASNASHSKEIGGLVRDINRHILTQGLKHVFNPDRFNYSQLHGLSGST